MRAALSASRRSLCTKATLNLPKTAFTIHGTPAKTEPALIKRLCHEHYRWQAERGAPDFVLHDGPPYANGGLHMGHFLNKVIKDFINRWMVLKGHRVHYVPGWDCHGLPIELRALQLAAERGETAAGSADPLTLRHAAAACAREAMADQRAGFERWGIMADWDRAYHTMAPEYEAAQLGVLAKLVARGLVYRRRRPVHWSPATHTALAEAELEYPDGHTSTAAHVAFRLALHGVPSEAAAGSAAARAPAALTSALAAGKEVVAVAWTTTPWTLPANQALCVGETIEYAAIRLRQLTHEMDTSPRSPAVRLRQLAREMDTSPSSPPLFPMAGTPFAKSPPAPTTRRLPWPKGP
jgi:isoleucyl-tRNA synthetase